MLLVGVLGGICTRLHFWLAFAFNNKREVHSGAGLIAVAGVALTEVPVFQLKGNKDAL